MHAYLGMRLETVKITELFKRPFVYVTSFIKLFVFPLVAYLLVYFLPFLDEEFKSSIFILSGAPCAAVILSLAELYNTEQELSANVVLVSTILCVVTLPILTVILDKTI
jgi:predicted permease